MLDEVRYGVCFGYLAFAMHCTDFICPAPRKGTPGRLHSIEFNGDTGVWNLVLPERGAGCNLPALPWAVAGRVYNIFSYSH